MFEKFKSGMKKFAAVHYVAMAVMLGVGAIGGHYITSISVQSNESHAAVTSFKDVKSTHWAYGTIKWAVNAGVVNGYPDGTFKPSKQVSEAEFLMMLVKTFQKVDASGATNHWADPVYRIAQDNNWPVKGISSSNLKARDTAMTRGEVAQLITSAKGINFLTNDAILYLLGTNMAAGKTGNTLSGYKANDYLTRAEAVAFIKKAKDSGLTELKERPTLPTSTDIIPDVVTAPAGMSAIKSTIDKTVANYPGYSTKAGNEGVTVIGSDGRSSVAYSKAQSANGNDQIISYQATNSDSIKILVAMMKAVGLTPPGNISSVLSQAVQDGKEVKVQAGNKTITITPHPTNMDAIYIYFK